MTRGPDTGRRWLDPHLAGVGLGLVLLAAFVFAGRGLGASGAFASVAATGVQRVAPEAARANPALQAYLGGWPDEGAPHPLANWLVFEIAGVLVGGFLSAWTAGRLRLEVERGSGTTRRTRLLTATCGGTLMGVGAVLARGCTSGQALTGGALLSVGSWIFIGAAFAAGYLAIPLVRGQWA
jgi:hypothetical protein